VTPRKSWSDKLKDWRRSHEEDYAKALLSDPKRTTLYQAIPHPGLVLLLGAHRSGKSALGHEVINQFHTKKKLHGIIHLPAAPAVIVRRVQAQLPKWVKVTSKTSEWPENAVIFYDETAAHQHARRSQSADAVDLERLMGVCGQMNQTIIFATHHTRKLDPNVIRDIFRIIYKKPTYAHATFERDELSDFTHRAREWFAQIHGEKSKKRACLMINTGDELEFLQFNNSTAPWWTERLSKLFRELELFSRDQEPKKKSKKGGS